MDANYKNQNNPIRVVMLPWLAYGHITPYLELAKKLTTRNFIIYLCSTPATLTSIEKKITAKLSQSIKLVPLLLPNLPDLPRKFHTTNGLPPHLMPRLKEAFDSSVEDFSYILSDIKPDLLIYDFQAWAPLVAKEQNIPAVQFITNSTTMSCFTFHYYKNPSIEFPFPEIYYRDYESSNMKGLLESANNPKDREIVFRVVERSCNIVLIKGFREIEGKYIDYVSSIVGKKFVPVGPLVQEPNPNENDDEISLDILSWLDKKENKSTVFVSFGSEYFLTKEDMDEIACGLELSQINFIWVLKFPKDNANRDNEILLEKKLPKGFLGRVGNRGKILVGWAPQTKILEHSAIGGFVSHCGWNSVMESMHFGVPIIAVPMQIDQPFIARLVEEVGVGVEVLRDKNRMLHRDSLATVIKQVVFEDCGASVRQRAADMREKLKAKGDEEIDEVVKELVGLCNKSSTKK
ncbi:hypothetical protein DH2020_016647 [Rehmannia glutinosa]|uniref:Glycosyltransferase n=1 Tax=Rehmannia glutinosa TaxID=99300 RepID=A0ABR0WNW7_REHGL